MCLIVFAYDTPPKYQLVLSANRDEFYKRPTAPAHFWEDHPDVLAGRDLEKMGTWMGVTKTGRFAAITNVRNSSSENADAKSRGELVSNYLCSTVAPNEYMKQVRNNAAQYNGFNLIVGDTASLYYVSNQNRSIKKLEPGIYGVSNATLDTPWPKVEKSKKRLTQCLTTKEEVNPDCLFDLLADDDKHPEDKLLPNTGIGLERERLLSSVFITSPDYGTRASTVLLIDRNGHVFFKERSFYPERKEVEYDFQIVK